jgi:hypothetical protein
MGRQMGEKWVRKDQEALERWVREREVGVEGDFIVVVVEEEVDC